MAAKKGGLGRGLDSLFTDSAVLQTPTPIERPSNAAPAQTTNANGSAAEGAEAVVYIKLSDIKPNGSQPRKTFNEDSLADLAASIKEHGVIQPILVRPSSVGYELVAGERRWRASRLAGLKEIPAIVRTIDEKTNAFYALIENMQREDLNAIEEAEGIKEIIDKYGLTQDETARVVGKSRPYVTNILRLLKLPSEVRLFVENGKLSLGHARAVAGLEGEGVQLAAARKAVEQGWSVRQIENYSALQPKKKQTKKKSAAKDAELKAAEERLSEKLGTKVSIDGSNARGKVVIEYFSQEELERIIETL